jgi:hypothetical protein
MGAGPTNILALCGTTAQEDLRRVALRPTVGVPSLATLVGDGEQ